MRLLDCDCGATLQAANDDELAGAVLEHVQSDHPDMQLDDTGARELVASKAYSATDS
jgi:predicted small metal-binding protein